VVWVPVYTKKEDKKILMWVPVCIYTGCQLVDCDHQKDKAPQVVGHLAGLLTTSVITSNEAAMKNNTTSSQPKFTWLFLGTPKGQTCTPVVIRVAADTENEAREWYSRWDLIFAAKISSECSLYQYSNGAFELNASAVGVQNA
jgi:hypothetical protein